MIINVAQTVCLAIAMPLRKKKEKKKIAPHDMLWHFRVI